MIHLLAISFIIVILCFTKKEGFYSDNNIGSALSSIRKLEMNLESMKKKINDMSQEEFGTIEIISNLAPLVNTDKKALLMNGVVTQVKAIVVELSKLQEESLTLQEKLKDFKEFNVLADAYSKKVSLVKDLLTKITD
jgi:ABC-type phosphate transport system auxiliary subunit